VGKVYNVMALLAAQDIIEQVSDIAAAHVYVLSQIGMPLDQPLVATATVRAKNGSLTDGAEEQVRAVLDAHLSDLSGIRTKLANQEIALY
jgi:S-adenosylmethionine synthetase